VALFGHCLKLGRYEWDVGKGCTMGNACERAVPNMPISFRLASLFWITATKFWGARIVGHTRPKIFVSSFLMLLALLNHTIYFSIQSRVGIVLKPLVVITKQLAVCSKTVFWCRQDIKCLYSAAVFLVCVIFLIFCR